VAEAVFWGRGADVCGAGACRGGVVASGAGGLYGVGRVFRGLIGALVELLIF